MLSLRSIAGLFCLTILAAWSSSGYCFSPYNPDGSGVLRFVSQAPNKEIKNAPRKQLSNLWFYDILLQAEEAPVNVTELGIIVEAHNRQPGTYKAMLASEQNVEKVWMYIQQVKPGQHSAVTAAELEESTTPHVYASDYITIPEGELSSQRNMFVAQFKNIAITIAPGDTIVLSFFSSCNGMLPQGTAIKGHNLVPLWKYTGRDMQFN